MSIEDKLTTIAENMQRVYTAGLDAGYRSGYEVAKAEQPTAAWCDYNAFWDGLQDLGDRTSYNYAFGTNWTDAMFVPKYKITPTGNGADNMFKDSNITDLATLLKNPELQDPDVALDFSNAESLCSTFENSKVTTLPDIDIYSCKDMTRTFYGAKDLKAVNLLCPKKNGNYNKDTVYVETFDSCESLETVTFTVPGVGNANGIITKVADARGLYFGDSPNLTGGSVMNIISALGSPTKDTDKVYVAKAVFHQDAYDRAEEFYETTELRPYYTWAQFIALATDKGWTIEIISSK